MYKAVASPEQQKAIMIHVAQMEANGKSKREIYLYLKEQGYNNPTSKYNTLRENGDYIIYLDKAKLMKEKLAKTGGVETEEVKVERNGVEYEKQPELPDVTNSHEKPELEDILKTIEDNCAAREAYDPQIEDKPKLVRSVIYMGDYARYRLLPDGSVRVQFDHFSDHREFKNIADATNFARELTEAVRLLANE